MVQVLPRAHPQLELTAEALGDHVRPDSLGVVLQAEHRREHVEAVHGDLGGELGSRDGRDGREEVGGCS